MPVQQKGQAKKHTILKLVVEKKYKLCTSKSINISRSVFFASEKLAKGNGKIAKIREREGNEKIQSHILGTGIRGYSHVAGALTERKKMFLGGSFFKLADDNKYIKNPEAQNREVRGF